MFSTITILSIFTEIFSAGALLVGTYVFLKRFRETFDRQFLFLGGIFLFFGAYVAGVILSQLLFNLGASFSSLIMMQRITITMLVLSALFVWAFAAERFRFKPFWFIYILAVIAGFLGFVNFSMPINLAYMYGIIEPVVEAPTIIPVRYFWIVSWLVLSSAYIMRASRTKDAKDRSLSLLSGISTILIAAGYSVSLLYVFLGEGIYLFFSWVIVLFAFCGLLVGTVIDPKDDIALHPFDFLKTRILFKLVLLFILMIILIIEATTIATISIARSSLSLSVIETDRQIALGVAERSLSYSKQFKNGQKLVPVLQKYIEDASLAQDRLVYIIDSDGRLIAHPDAKRAAVKEDLRSLAIVRRSISRSSGGEEFFDETGARMVGAYAPVEGSKYRVIVVQPIQQAYSEIRRMETNSLLFVIIGIGLAIIVGIFFAKSIEESINTVIKGTEAVKKGNLNYRIDTKSLDEIGRLAKAFNSMTAELKESQDHLIASEKLAALGTMAAGMAHEIKNPLVALRTFSQLLPMKWEDMDFRDKFISIIPQEIEKINKIAENLLKFGRPSKPEFKLLDLNQILEEVLELLENQLKKNNIRVSTKFAKLPKVNGDSGQLSQSFLNIVLNAVQAMTNGGELIIKSDVGHVIQLGNIGKEGFIPSKLPENPRSQEKVPTVFIEITDSGPGIPEEVMKNMFDPFYTTKADGTGMGLPITLRIIEDHKGSIKVRSQQGKGSTFIIMMPAAE